MKAADIFSDLRGIGFGDSDVGQIMGLYPSEVAALNRGMALSPLAERRALSSFIGFKRRAQLYIDAVTGG